MNFNVWNIKEMMSIPSGSGMIKSSNRNNNQTDCSALSDSQFLFGSQFCPENSESLSAPLDLGPHLRNPKQTKQNSMELNEPSILTKYQTKPQLFEDNTKDEVSSTFSLPLPVAKSKGLLKQFEEKKKWATDKCDSETLYNLISRVGESIHRLQTSVEKSEEHLSSRSQALLDSLKNMTNTLHETTQVQNNLMCETVQDKGNRDQAILEIQKSFENRQEEFIEVKSIVKHLEVVVTQQSKDFQQLSEQLSQLNVPSVLDELRKLISMLQVPRHVKDGTSQTSPLSQSLNFTRKEKYTSEDPITWQAQTSPVSGKTSMDLRPGEIGVWDEGAKTNALQEDAGLPAVESCEENGHVKSGGPQSNCRNQAGNRVSPKNQDSGISGYKVCDDRALVSQGDSQLISQDSTTSVKNGSTEQQAQSMLACDSGEQLKIKRKGSMVGRRRKGRRKARRVRCPVKKKQQTPSDSKHQSPQSPVSGPQGLPMRQQEPQAQPLHQGLRRCTNAVSYDLREPINSSRRAGATPPTSCFSPEDHKISWFNSLSDGNSGLPLFKKKKKTLLCDFGLDSSDDDANPQ
ncbi:interactor of HORMAD1 protein 1 [Perognathus longimembris pacificus]|uniref:interactor of HORMAD1 protein 1 n=1 Tax=Perognathus longimembris pacificus TaxID=214514 RepID=UPI002018CFEC|nr:interactor of HORMAD1 protein 1 [Perognathus longimembris pacificus]